MHYSPFKAALQTGALFLYAQIGGDSMAKDFAKAFYSSKAWQDCRNSYAAKRMHLCERCLARGIYRPGDIVHHVIEITPETINKPEVALNHDNLRLLCRDCHAEVHKTSSRGRRYLFGENGEVIIDDTAPLLHKI